MQEILFLTTLAAASAVDCRKRTIPDSLCILTAAAGLISFSPAQFFGVLAALPLLIAALIRPECMGGGDIKLAVLIGLTLGWLGWPQLIVGAFAAFFVGGIISIVLLALHKVKLRGGIPFGPSMVIGAWIGIYAGALIANWYLQISGLA